MALLLHNVGTDNPKAFESPYGRFKGYTAAEYLDRIRKMHDKLAHLLTQPAATWPKTDAFATPKR